jgi:hypothetical protein
MYDPIGTRYPRILTVTTPICVEMAWANHVWAYTYSRLCMSNSRRDILIVTDRFLR